MSPEEFFKALGYLSNQDRSCKLDAEVPFDKERFFRDKYLELSGIIPSVDNHNFYLWTEGANKWSIELRIYFRANENNIPRAILSMVVSSRPNTDYNCRINNNAFIWQLIQYGFVLSDTQNVQRIRERVPAEYISFFEEGFSI